MFNQGINCNEDLVHMIRVIEDNIGKQATIHYDPIQLGDVLESFADIRKSQQLLNYHPITNIDIGLPRFISWYKEYTV